MAGIAEPALAVGWDSGQGEDGLCWVMCPWTEDHLYSGNDALPLRP
ncbi:hypothetical protein OG539_43475 [Actinacidiphila glaucinigra]